MTNDKCGDRADAQTVDPAPPRADAGPKNRDVAPNPGADFHSHTGNEPARRCYDMTASDALPMVAVESFAGAAKPSEPGPVPSRRRPAVRILEEDARRGRPRRHRLGRTMETLAVATDETNVRGYDVPDYRFRVVKL